MKALCIVIGIFLLATAQGEAQKRGYAPGQIILSFENKEDAVLEMSEGRMTCMFSTVMSILERYEATWMRRLYSGNKGAQNIYLIELSSDAHVNPAIAEFRNDPAIKSAMRNYAIEFLAKPNDWYFNNDYIPPGYPLVEDQWYLKVMQADKAWDVERGNANIKIGILDTGIDFMHQDLGGNIWVNPGEDLDGDGVVWDADDLDFDDSDGNGKVDDLVGWTFVQQSIGHNYPFPDIGGQHGTMMASVGAVTNNDTQSGDTSIAGISWHCKVVPLKMGDWSATAVIEALNYAATMGIDVVNMSFHLLNIIDPDSIASIHEAIIAAKNAEVVLVAAVNPQSPLNVTYPHGFEEVIAVTVVDENGVLNPGYGYHSGVDVCGLGISDWVKEVRHFNI